MPTCLAAIPYGALSARAWRSLVAVTWHHHAAAVAGGLAVVLATGMPARAQEYYYYPPPYYAPPPPPVYVYPPTYYPPTVIVRPAPVARGLPPPQFWYWCDDPRGYYPSVGSCSRAWREVPASATAPAEQSEQKPK